MEAKREGLVLPERVRQSIAAAVTEHGVQARMISTQEAHDSMRPPQGHVVIAAPQTPQTVGLFDGATLDRMRADAWLINVGRGPIVDTDALVARLSDGRLGGAALDVFEEEPLPPGHPLWSLPNAILTPHVAAASELIAGRHLDLLTDNVRRFADGRPLRNVVDKRQYRRAGR